MSQPEHSICIVYDDDETITATLDCGPERAKVFARDTLTTPHVIGVGVYEGPHCQGRPIGDFGEYPY